MDGERGQLMGKLVDLVVFAHNFVDWAYVWILWVSQVKNVYEDLFP